MKKIKKIFFEKEKNRKGLRKTEPISVLDDNESFNDLDLIGNQTQFEEIRNNNLKENINNNMTEPNKDNQNLANNEQPSIGANDINTRKGNANIGNTARDNADFKSIESQYNNPGTFNGPVSQGGNSRAVQNNSNADKESRLSLEFERAKTQKKGLEDKAKNKLKASNDKESQKLL